MDDKIDVVQYMAQMKQYMMYGAQIAYPFITAFTAIGVAKVAFSVPPEIAFVCLLGAVLSIGIISFKIGLYSKDYEIQWVNTPSAKELCDRVKKIERIIDEKH